MATAPEGDRPAADAANYDLIFDRLVRGGITPFFGAGVNLVGRPPDFVWTPSDRRFLPNGRELTDHLAGVFRFPDGENRDLLRVAQYAYALVGGGDLYAELRARFHGNFPPNALHELFARIPGELAALGYGPHYPLIVTTNYDELLERAFVQAGAEFDLIFYRSEEEQRGHFVHRLPDGTVVDIESPNDYDPTLLSKRTTILKIHGAVDREDADSDSYVITEDDYINFLAHNDLSNLVPRALKARMVSSHFLFLGYSLRDWNLRAFLHRLWAERRRSSKSWAIQLDVDELDRFSWAKHDVRLFQARLEDWIDALAERLDRLPPAPPREATPPPE